MHFCGIRNDQGTFLTNEENFIKGLVKDLYTVVCWQKSQILTNITEYFLQSFKYERKIYLHISLFDKLLSEHMLICECHKIDFILGQMCEQTQDKTPSCYVSYFFSRRHKSRGQFPTDIATTSTSVNKCSNKFSFSVISHTFLHFPNPKQLLHYEKYSLFFCCIWVDKYDIFLSIKVDVSFALT